MDEIKEITPAHLRCTFGGCPAVFESNPEEVIIVGKKADLDIMRKLEGRVAEDEYVVVIRREFLENLTG
jgi:hypothetical protein